MPINSVQFTMWAATWILCLSAFALILWRPRGIPEYTWAVTGAGLLVISHLLPLKVAWQAVRSGTNVYQFLFGMLLLSELARLHGVFDWLAQLAVKYARGSQLRLFGLIYGIGIAVTALLSNDATAVLLTPAVLAVVRRSRVSPLPYLFACAMVANAASFLLPISNPANLLVFQDHMPSLGEWIPLLLPSAVSAIAVTFFLLLWHSWASLRLPMQNPLAATASLSPAAKRVAAGILLAACALLTASALGKPVGPVALVAGIAVTLLSASRPWRRAWMPLKSMSWNIIPLVAGLFVMVSALQRAGAQTLSSAALNHAADWPPIAGLTAIGFGYGLAANLINNLPMGLIGASAVHTVATSRVMHAAVLIGVDLGPNLSVTGSLATILWLVALRRDKIDVSARQFLRIGILIMPPVLFLAIPILVRV